MNLHDSIKFRIFSYKKSCIYDVFTWYITDLYKDRQQKKFKYIYFAAFVKNFVIVC